MHYLIFKSQLRSCNSFKCVYNVKISSSLNFGHAGQNILAQDVKLHAFACLTPNKNQCLHSRAEKKQQHTAVLVLLQEIPKRRKLLRKNGSFEFCLPSTVGEKEMPSLS